MIESPIKVFNENEEMLFNKWVSVYRILGDSIGDTAIVKQALNGVATVIINEGLGRDLQIVKDSIDRSIIKP